MGNHKTPGLTKRGGIWHFDKIVRGTRIRGSTGTGDLAEAQEQLAKQVADLRNARVYGTRAERTFRAAATKYLQENQQKRTIGDDAMHLRALDPFVGELSLRQVHMGALQEFIARRRKDRVKTSTINQSLAVVRHILKLAESEWMDAQGMTWLERSAKIKLLPVHDARKAYPLTREEQALFFQELPDYLARMALFKVNTGCREQEVCKLKWEYEVEIPELKTSVFMIPGEKVKNAEDRLVVLNRVAKSIIEAQRGIHAEYVFARVPKNRKARTSNAVWREPKPMERMNGTAWKHAREIAANKWEAQTGQPAPLGFRRVRVHDMKHTFGRRLRAAGVSFEDRQDLLGHKNGKITTHYSQAELANLIAAADSVCGTDPHNFPTITLLRRKSG